jgi:hypothetical protein
MRTATNQAIAAILPAFQYKRPVKYATAPRTITITFSYRQPHYAAAARGEEAIDILGNRSQTLRDKRGRFLRWRKRFRLIFARKQRNNAAS